MLKIYFEEVPGLRTLPIVYCFDRERQKEHFEHLPFRSRAHEQLIAPFIERAENPEMADYLLIPHIYKDLLKNNHKYIEKIINLAKETKKRVIIFAFQDSTVPIDIPEAIIFRMSSYASEMKKNEFIMPYIVEDLLENKQITIRKIPKKPIVGFVGWASFDTFKQRIRSGIKETLLHFRSLFTNRSFLGFRRKGLYLRMEMLRILRKSSEIETNFIIRETYSGYTKSFQKQTVEEMRNEYVRNIAESDITLAPRGEGNGSQRFYEVLSLGRIPLLIDTDTTLPLEELIPYERFVIKVSYSDRKKVVSYINAFFDGLTEAEYATRQREARKYYETYLSVNAYHAFLFKDEYLRVLEKTLP